MIYFRVDANSHIGMGHIMRCLSLADAASSMNNAVCFILADDCVKELVNKRGYSAIVLHSDYTMMEQEQWPQIQANCIIVDSYYVTENYLILLKKKTELLVYIDDLASFPYPVDILVNYNLYGPHIDYHGIYKNTHEPRLVLGSSYIPLRSMFKNTNKKTQRRSVKDILISTGGSDPYHVALKFLQAEPKKYYYHILIGKMNADKEKIKKLAEGNQYVQLHENVSDMKNLICEMDIAVSAAGTTLYEISACGIPLITYISADNQIKAAAMFEKLGLALNLGDIREREKLGTEIQNAVEALATDYTHRVSVGHKMQKMIDGSGAERLMEKIIYYEHLQKKA